MLFPRSTNLPGSRPQGNFAVREQIKLLLEASNHGYIAPTVLAEDYSLVNEKDQAFQWLEKAYADCLPDLVNLNLDPDL